MISRVMSAQPAGAAAQRGSRFSVWTARSMSLLTLGTFLAAYLTPPRSGPLCTMSNCVGPPYTDVAAFFPRDYLWMVPATVLALVFVACMACVHHYAAPERKLFSLLAVAFATLAAGMIALDYFIQLTVVQPSLLRGETDGLALISQYNPHGIFIALETLGYLLMSVVFVCASAVFTGRTGVEQLLRWLFRVGFGLALGGLVLFTLAYGHDLEYRFEIYIISIDWLVLIIGGALLSVLFKRAQLT